MAHRFDSNWMLSVYAVYLIFITHTRFWDEILTIYNISYVCYCRIKPSPASTKRLILTYENIIYERITPYIVPLLELRWDNSLVRQAWVMRHESKQVLVFLWNCPHNLWMHESSISQLMGTFKTCDCMNRDLNLNIFHLHKYVRCSKGILLGIGSSKFSNFESWQFQPISAKCSDWGLFRSPQSKDSDYKILNNLPMLFSSFFAGLSLFSTSSMMMSDNFLGRNSTSKRTGY